ncbi:P-loop containing nucleoside triphosphate hydrolase protein [Pleurotus eryngii]|uniref:DNA 3'-5' helicase n=1 Tax=Pleurotus eryngii TaxID=5323 RepID=A0A9P6DG37_PLEER|nr:P-loop containing nucleoside triphosphate hydrolase protein [Pleurotus eryngii]
MSTTASMVAASSEIYCTFCSLNFDNVKAQKKHEIEIHGKTYSLLLDKKITYVLTRKRSDAPVQCPLCNHQVFSVVDLHYHMKKLHKALKTSIERTDNHDPPIHPPHLSFHSTQALSVASQDPPAVPLRMLSSAKAGPSKFKGAFQYTPSQPSPSPPVQQIPAFQPQVSPTVSQNPNIVQPNFPQSPVPHSSSHPTTPKATQRDPDVLPFSSTTPRPQLIHSSSGPSLTKLLKDHGLCYNSEWKILICNHYQAGFSKEDILGHLKSASFKIGKGIKEAMRSGLNTLEFRKKRDPTPKADEDAVEGLAVEEGHQCLICSYCAPQSKTIRNHLSQNHSGHLGSAKDNMNNAYIQTLYSTNDIYYSVRMPLPQSTNPMLHDYITSILPTIQQSDILLPGVSTLDYPVEVQMIGWHNHLATYLQSKVATRGLTSLLGPVSSTTRISQLKPFIIKYLKVCGGLGEKLSFKMRRMLKSYPLVEGSEAWKPLTEFSTISSYADVLNMLMVAIFRTITKDPETPYKFPLTKEDHQRLREFRMAFFDSDSLNQEDQMESFHHFIYPFFSSFGAEEEDDSNKWGHILECYFAVIAVREDGSFKKPKELTNTLARIKYICRCVIVFQASTTKYMTNTLLSEIEANIHTNAYSAFNMAAQYSTYLTHLVYNTPSAPITKISNNCEKIYYKTCCLNIPTFLHGLENIYQSILELFKMLWRRHTFKYTIPEEFVDDWTNDTRGFSWCTDPAHPNQPHPFAKEHQLLEILINDPHLKLFTRGPNNTLIPNPAAILSILEQCQKINLQLAIYTYLTAGASPRASESVDFKITNGTRDRNVFYHSGDIWLVTRRVKSEGQKGHEDFIPFKCHPRLSELLKMYLLGIRPMERQLARLVWNEEVGQLYDTQLWIHNKQVIKSDYFSNCLGTMMNTYCQVKDCKVRAWRQLSVAMGRMYLGNTFEVDLEEGSILAAQRSHSIQVERVHYAPEEGHLPSLSSDTLLQYGLASEAWARMLGCYPNQPLLVPILLQKRQQLFTSPSTSLAISQSSTQTATQLLDTNHLAVTLAQSLAVQMAKLQEGIKHQINIAVATAVEKAMLNIPGHIEHHFNHHQLDLAPPSNQLQLPPMTTISNVRPSQPSSINTLPEDLVDMEGPAFQLLRALFNNQKATFKSPMQRHLVELSLARENNFIAVLPTGGGKSLIYQLAGLKDAGTNFKTVVVVPCKALLQDQLNKAIRLGIPCIKYVVNSSGLLPAGYSRASLIFVALETAVTSNFRILFNNAEEFIVRLVIDEAHLAMTQQEFREPFSKLKGLSDLSVQKIWLTATLPPSKEKLLKEELGARPSTPVLRIPTPQPLIGYHHILIDPNTCAFLDYIEAIMNKIHITYMLPGEKAIIFVQSINDAKYLAPKFGNLVSHSSMESSEKMENEHRWMTGQDHWCIVATTGMIHGVDHPAVSAVIFAGFPYNIINMIQGAGRGGRGGNKAIAVVVEQHRVNITMVRPKTGHDGDPQCLRESEKWLTNGDLCHRVIISNLMDGIPHTCQDLAQIYPQVEYCNICNPASPLFADLFQVS